MKQKEMPLNHLHYEIKEEVLPYVRMEIEFSPIKWPRKTGKKFLFSLRLLTADVLEIKFSENQFSPRVILYLKLTV